MEYMIVNMKFGITKFPKGSIEIVPLETNGKNSKVVSIVLDSYFKSNFEKKIKDSLFKASNEE